MTYYVWDREMESRETAREISVADSPEGAAEFYAELDSDGLSEGNYDPFHGCALCVLAEGETEPTIYNVTVDWSPTFTATKA